MTKDDLKCAVKAQQPQALFLFGVVLIVWIDVVSWPTGVALGICSALSLYKALTSFLKFNHDYQKEIKLLTLGEKDAPAKQNTLV